MTEPKPSDKNASEPEAPIVIVPKKASIVALRDRIARDPTFFVTEILGESPLPWQLETLRSWSRRGAVVGAHGTGKDRLAAWYAWAFRIAFAPARVYVIGPTEKQIEDVMWEELKEVYYRCKRRGYPLGGRLTHLKHESSSGSFMRAVVAKTPEAIQGRHYPRQLVIFDESPGIRNDVQRAAMSLVTGEQNWVFAVGNPTDDTSSWWYELFTKLRDLWRIYRFDGHECVKAAVPGMISQAWIDEQRRIYGEESPVYQMRVRGMFPKSAADSLIALAWIEVAEKLDASKLKEPPEGKGLGVDVARYGDDLTVFALVDRARLVRLEIRQGQNLMETVGQTITIAQEEGIAWENVAVDDTGLGGGVTDRLREQGYGVLAVNFGSEAFESEKFANLRTELLWRVRERLRTQTLALPEDPMLVRDLAAFKYRFRSDRGKIELEAKKETKKRLGYSPDRADALALALYAQASGGAIAILDVGNDAEQEEATDTDDGEAKKTMTPSEKRELLDQVPEDPRSRRSYRLFPPRGGRPA